MSKSTPKSSVNTNINRTSVLDLKAPIMITPDPLIQTASFAKAPPGYAK